MDHGYKMQRLAVTAGRVDERSFGDISVHLEVVQFF